jgi:hypothetical protein
VTQIRCLSLFSLSEEFPGAWIDVSTGNARVAFTSRGIDHTPISGRRVVLSVHRVYRAPLLRRFGSGFGRIFTRRPIFLILGLLWLLAPVLVMMAGQRVGICEGAVCNEKGGRYA